MTTIPKTLKKIQGNTNKKWIEIKTKIKKNNLKGKKHSKKNFSHLFNQKSNQLKSITTNQVTDQTQKHLDSGVKSKNNIIKTSPKEGNTLGIALSKFQ